MICTCQKVSKWFNYSKIYYFIFDSVRRFRIAINPVCNINLDLLKVRNNNSQYNYNEMVCMQYLHKDIIAFRYSVSIFVEYYINFAINSSCYQLFVLITSSSYCNNSVYVTKKRPLRIFNLFYFADDCT